MIRPAMMIAPTILIHGGEVTDQEGSELQPWLKDFLLTWVSRFGVFLAHHVTRPLIPLYLITFGASSTVIGAFMAVFTITATVTRVPIGLLIDRIGRKPFLLYGTVLFGAGNFGYLWAPSIALMIPGRILHGLGWSGCTTAVTTIAADIVPQKRRGEMMGYAGMASSKMPAIFRINPGRITARRLMRSDNGPAIGRLSKMHAA